MAKRARVPPGGGSAGPSGSGAAEGPAGGPEARARSLAAAGRHAEAAAAWTALAEGALAAGDRLQALSAHQLAGDALRRDDRPAAAARALHAALGLLNGDPAERPRRDSLKVLLAATLGDAGQGTAGVVLLRELLASRPAAAARVLALDVLAGLLLGLGRVSEAWGVQAELDAEPGAAPAAALPFREAALTRLAGDLDGAQARLRAALASAPAAAAWEGPRAAIREELAEIDLLRGRLDDAAAGFARAGDGWGRAGRRAGVFRAEAGRIKVELARGGLPLPSALHDAVDYADERGLPGLATELRMARGAARARAGLEGAAADLDRAVELAAAHELLLLEGRARMVRRGAGLGRGDEARMRVCLAEDRWWSRQI